MAARLAQANLAAKADIADFVKKTDFDNKLINLYKNITSNKTKHVLVSNELNELLEKVKVLWEKDYSFSFRRMLFTNDGVSENMSLCQPTPDALELKTDKVIDYVHNWKSKGAYTFKFTQLYTIFLNSTKLCGCGTGIKFNNRVLVVEQNIYACKIVFDNTMPTLYLT